jgi:predicted O-methyltransferase YrrM
MDNMTPDRWANTARYLQETFGRVRGHDRQLETLMERAVAAGLPDIAVSAEVGRLLKILCMTVTHAPGSRGTILELGTLAGYSGIWLARGLPSTGRLITVEKDPTHAAFAQREFSEAGVGQQVQIVTGAALDVLPGLNKRFGMSSLDLIFMDAVKTEYSDYLRAVKPMLRSGGLLLADNALGSNVWWIDDPAGSSPEMDAIRRFNEQVAGDPDFEAACVPVRQGVLIARRN